MSTTLVGTGLALEVPDNETSFSVDLNPIDYLGMETDPSAKKPSLNLGLFISPPGGASIKPEELGKDLGELSKELVN